MATRHIIKRITNGLLNSTIDLLLFQITLVGASVGKSRSPQGVSRAFEETFAYLEEVNHHTIRSAWSRMRRKGLVEVAKDELFYRPLITHTGKERLKQAIPTYRNVRVWDKRIYIVTYDIPERGRWKRNLFREFLKTIGAARLQLSVWLTPYNPRSLINEFMQEYNVEGTVIISDTGTNGTIGEERIEELVIRVYNLEELNMQYEDFLASYKQMPSHEGIFVYLTIVADDPQLPFELLPVWWRGDEAYEAYKVLCNRMKEGINQGNRN